MFIEEDMMWLKYALYDDEGDVIGISDDAPKDIKEAYQRYLDEKNRYIELGKRIPK